MDAIEKTLLKLNDVLSKKQIQTLEIIGKCDKNGRIIQQYTTQMEFKEENTYYVSLIELTTTSFFPNITEANNKFYYSGKDKNVMMLTLPTGAYDIDDYNQYICTSIPKVGDKNPIVISLHKPTGKVIINLNKSEGFKVYFDKPNTFRNEFGFDNVVLSEEENTSSNMADIVKTQKVYVSCDIAKGSNLNGKSTHIIYSFPNEKRYGYPLSIVPNKKQYKQLQDKSFNKITLTFTDENGKPVDFQGANTTVSLEIKEI